MIPALDDLHAALANETDRQNQGILLPLDPDVIKQATKELEAIRFTLNNTPVMSESRQRLEDDRDNLVTALEDLQRVRDEKINRIAYSEGSRTITSLFAQEQEVFDRVRTAWETRRKKAWRASG